MRSTLNSLSLSIFLAVTGCAKKLPVEATRPVAPVTAPSTPEKTPAPAEGEPVKVAGEGEPEPVKVAGEGEGEPEPVKAPEAAPVGLGFDLVFAPETRMPAADCEAIVTREFALVAESGTDEMKEGAAKTTPADAAAKCRAAPFPKAAADCLRTATTASAMFRECYTIPFQGRDLTTLREFTANDPANAAADPPMFSQHGDIVMIRKGCGLLLQKLESFTAAFLVCDGKTTGPVTTSADIREMFAALSAEESARHKLVMGIIGNYPSGGTGRYRVCNAAGVCRVE